MTASLTSDAPLTTSGTAGSVAPIAASAAAPDVEIIGVTKRFGDVTAVDAMDLSIARGTFYSLLGPSGCGKTTTLRMIAGFEQPTEGEILLAGQPIAGVPPYHRNVNTVFQHYALFPHMDVAQNVGYGLRQRKVAQGRGAAPGRRGARARSTGGLRPAPDLGDVRRPAAAGRAGTGAREPPHRPAPRRAARRTRPQAAQGDAARAQGPPARGRDHVRVRDPRPGGSAHDERRHRRHARRPDPAAGRARPSCTSARSTGSWPPSSGRRTSCRPRSTSVDGATGGSASTRTSGSTCAGIRTDPGAAVAVGDAVTVAIRPERVQVVGRADRRDGRARLGCQSAGRIHQGTYLGDQTEFRVQTDQAGEVIVRRQNATGAEAAWAWDREIPSPCLARGGEPRPG